MLPAREGSDALSHSMVAFLSSRADFDEIYLQPPQAQNLPAEIDNVFDPEPFDNVLRFYTFDEPFHAIPINLIVLGL